MQAIAKPNTIRFRDISTQVTVRTDKKSYLTDDNLEYVIEIKKQAINQCNKECELQCKWSNWDDLYFRTFNKSQHGKFTQFFNSYQGLQGTFQHKLCTKCPKIVKAHIQKMRDQDSAQRIQTCN